MPSRSLLLLALLVAPAAARAGLLDAELTPPGAPPDLRPRALARSGPQEGGEQEAQPAPAPGDLDFDLLGEAEPPPDAPDAARLKRRRQLLTAHQGVGLGLFALQLGTTVLGQLNYRDKFATPANTAKWRTPHKVLAYATAGAFALDGTLALLAPAPEKRPWRLDRVGVHRVAMFTAAAGMLAQVGLGVYTASREGHEEQRGLAKAHLYLGYGTLAAMATGVGVLVF